jgi:perosamine synthetase
LSELTKKGIGCNNYFPPIHLQPFYQVELGYKKRDFPITESISKRTIALPFHNNLTNTEIEYIVTSLKELLEQKKIPLNTESLVDECYGDKLQYSNF